MEQEMRTVIFLSLLALSGCSFLSKPMTRLVPKIEMHSPPPELMTPPKPLKPIVQPDASKKDAPAPAAK